MFYIIRENGKEKHFDTESDFVLYQRWLAQWHPNEIIDLGIVMNETKYILAREEAKEL